MSCPTKAVSHDGWPQREKAFMENPPELALELQEHLKYLSESLSETLQPALALEQRFGECNDKTMYLAPFIQSVVHAAAPAGIDIQHLSLYPLPVDPCVTRDPLLRTIRVPRYGIVTGIICASIPFPIDYQEPSNDSSSVHDETADSEEEEQSSFDIADYIAGKGMENFTPTNGYATYSRSAVLSHSFLARLTIDLVEERTPLGLLCIAHAEDIHSAMTSCLFQRLAWGIREPLVGISLDDTTSIVQVLIGWLEDSDKFDCFVIHVAQDDSRGSYDLSDTSQALKFASVLANVAQRFLTIRTTAMAFTEQLKLNISEGRLKNWRMDQTGLTPCIVLEKEPSFVEKIVGWMDGVGPLPVALSEDIKVEQSQLCPSSTTMPPNPATQPSTQGPRTRSMGPIEVRVSGPGAQTDEGNEDATGGNTPPSQGKQVSLRPPALTERQSSGLSASKLAGGDGEDDASRPTRFWLVARLATTRTLYYHGMLNAPKQFAITTQEDLYHKICMEYHNLVTFTWLDTDKHPLDEDFTLLGIANEAESAVAKMKSRGTGQYPPYKPLSVECDQLLRENLWELSSALEIVRRSVATGKQLVCEIQCRLVIDRLLMKFFHGKVDGTAEELNDADYKRSHIMVSLERSIMLPRGYLTELSSDLDDLDYLKLLDSTVKPELSGPLLEDCQFMKNPHFPSQLASSAPPAALRSYQHLQNDIQKLQAVTTIGALNLNDQAILAVRTARDLAEMYHTREPVKAVCDSIGYIRIPEVFSSITASQSFNVIHPPSKKSGLKPKSKSKSTEALIHVTASAQEPSRTTISPLLAQQVEWQLDVKYPDDLYAASQNFALSLTAADSDSPPKKTLAGGAPISEEKLSPVESQTHSIEGHLVQVRGYNQLQQKKTINIRRDLFLPIISVEYKKSLESLFLTGINQQRMYATAAVKFYAALGIYGLGVYNIVSEGQVLVVTVAYGEELKNDRLPNLPSHDVVHGSKHDLDFTELLPSKVHIIERNTFSFDLSTYLGLLNFVTFLIKLRIEYVLKVMKVVKEKMVEASKSKKEPSLESMGTGMRKYLQSKSIPTGGKLNLASWRRHRPERTPKPE